MLLEPTQKYINYIQASAHYLNSPKHMFNHEINSLVRGYSPAMAESNLRVLFHLAGYKITNDKLGQLIKFHQSTHVQKFSKINVNVLTPAEQSVADRMNEKVNAYIENGTEYYPAMFGGGVKSVPSYPFRTSL